MRQMLWTFNAAGETTVHRRTGGYIEAKGNGPILRKAISEMSDNSGRTIYHDVGSELYHV